jgi:hypothetical protein
MDRKDFELNGPTQQRRANEQVALRCASRLSSYGNLEVAQVTLDTLSSADAKGTDLAL